MLRDADLPVDVERWLRGELLRHLPAVLGSLTLRRSPCIRSGCHLCQTGEQHPSYVFYGRVGGKRFAVYIPDELVPALRQAVANGRALQQLLREAGRRYAEALKHERRRRR